MISKALRPLTLFLIFIFLLGCTDDAQVPAVPAVPAVPDETYTEPEATLDLADIKYTLFILNVHDWLLGEDSIETVNKVIDIHEEYEIPVNIYLTDPMVQLYVEEAPDLIERLRTSEYVTVSYHTRPPSPYYSNFDIIGLHELSDEEIYDKIMEYETHKIDLSTGLPTEEEGGYAYLTELMGYAPVTAAVASEYKNVVTQAIKVYKDLGATFTLVHGKETLLGDKKGALYLRPEQIELKLYESKGLESKAADVIEAAMADFSGDSSKGIFLNIKFHEDNYYLKGTPWLYNFFTDGKESDPKSVPFDIETVKVNEKSELEKAHIWELYEEGVQYVKENEETMHPISEFDLQEMIKSL